MGRFYEYALDQLTAAQRGTVVRRVFDDAKRGETIELPAGTYDFGSTFVRFPDFATVRGAGRDRTLFVSSAVFTADAGCSFELGMSSVVEELTLQSTCATNQQSALVGYGVESQLPRQAILRRCNLVGRVWGVYLWPGPDGNQLLVEDCDITSGRVCVALCRSSGAGAGYLDLSRCRLFGVPSATIYQGAVSDPTFGGVIGMICRGGRLRAWDCHIQANGAVGLPRVVGVTNWFDGGSNQSTIELYGLHSRLKPAGAVQAVYDIDPRTAATVWSIGGSGSGLAGKFLVEPTNQVTWMDGRP